MRCSLLGSVCPKFESQQTFSEYAHVDLNWAQGRPVNSTKTGFRQFLTGKLRCCSQKTAQKLLENPKQQIPTAPTYHTFPHFCLLNPISPQGDFLGQILSPLNSQTSSGSDGHEKVLSVLSPSPSFSAPWRQGSLLTQLCPNSEFSPLQCSAR